MVFYLSAVFLALAHLVPLVASRLAVSRRGAAGDVFSPALFVVGMSALGVPYLFLVAGDRSYLSYELLHSPWLRDLEGVTAAYVVVIAATLALTLLGASLPLAGAVAARLPRLGVERFTPARTRLALLVSGGLGGGLYLYYLHSMGGLQMLWAYMYLRTMLSSGLGYLGMVYTALLMFFAALLVFRLRFGANPLRVAATVAGVLGVALVLASTGGRAPVLHLLVLVFLTHHYGVRRRRRLLTPGVAALGCVLFAFAVIVPLFRSTSAYVRYTTRPELLVKDGGRAVSRVAPQFSPFDRTAVMLAYFTPERMWLGRSYLDLVYAPIPRSLYPDKPPVDDGIYFKTIVDGRHVVPSLPARQMLANSWPMGNLVGYMNFGVAGLIAVMVLSGVAIGAAYRYVAVCGGAPLAIVLYEAMAMGGGVQFSVFGIVQFLTNTTVAVGFFWLFFAPKRWPRPAARPLAAAA
ncbi:MAG TPA: hypothetical protein VM890_03810 [Longimicrobium sp.]|nr:hypothetical protein [Longimicrobium sp.]